MNLELMDNEDHQEAMRALGETDVDEDIVDEVEEDSTDYEENIEEEAEEESDDDSDSEEEHSESEELEEGGDDHPPWAERFRSDEDLWKSYRHIETAYTQKSQEAAELKRIISQLEAQKRVQVPLENMSQEEQTYWENESEASGLPVETLVYFHRQHVAQQEVAQRDQAYQAVGSYLKSHPDFSEYGTTVGEALQQNSGLIEMLDAVVPPSYLPEVVGHLTDLYFRAVKLQRLESQMPEIKKAAKQAVAQEVNRKNKTKRMARGEISNPRAANPSKSSKPDPVGDILQMAKDERSWWRF